MKLLSKVKFMKHLDKLIIYGNKPKLTKFDICFIFIRLVELSKIYCIGKRELSGCKPEKYHYTDLEMDLTSGDVFDKNVIYNIKNRNKLVHRISGNLELCEDLYSLSKPILYSLQMLKEMVIQIPDDFQFDEDFKEKKAYMIDISKELGKPLYL